MSYEFATYLTNLVDGDVVSLRVGDHPIVFYRNGDAVQAFQGRCPHQGADLGDGIVSRGHLICPQHGWRFRLSDGALDFQPDTCLRTYGVVIQDGAVFVELA